MKERPIAFSKQMVESIYDGRKTQTRRVVKFPKDFTGEKVYDNFPFGLKYSSNIMEDTVQRLYPPWATSDILWVKETYYQRGSWRKNGLTKKGNQKWQFKPADDIVLYENTKPTLFEISRNKDYPTSKMWYKRLGRFMPKKYARLFLEITKIRVEQIKDISFNDALAEGLKKFGRGERAKYGLDGWVESYSVPCKGCHTLDDKPWRAFAQLWQGINGLDSWNDNPWVWVIEFKLKLKK